MTSNLNVKSSHMLIHNSKINSERDRNLSSEENTKIKDLKLLDLRDQFDIDMSVPLSGEQDLYQEEFTQNNQDPLDSNFIYDNTSIFVK
jgi:hypothetical protein